MARPPSLPPAAAARTAAHRALGPRGCGGTRARHAAFARAERLRHADGPGL